MKSGRPLCYYTSMFNFEFQNHIDRTQTATKRNLENAISQSLWLISIKDGTLGYYKIKTNLKIENNRIYTIKTTSTNMFNEDRGRYRANLGFITD